MCYSKIDERVIPTRHIPTNKIRSVAMKRAAFRCSFEGCQTPIKTNEGAVVLEIAHILPRSLGGDSSLDNIIVLCPSHHRLVDMSEQEFGPDVLRRMRADHEQRILKSAEKTNTPPSLLPQSTKVSLKQALEFWDSNRDCDNEAVWHQFFVTNPHILALSLPGNALQFGDKCFLGGKDLFNHNGSIVDFLYVPETLQGVTLFEIKTPQSPLLGSEYRNRCFPPSLELAGSVVQSLHYRNLAFRHLDELVSGLNPKPSTSAVHAAVIVGNRNVLGGNQDKQRSFELFKAAVRDVQIITYDELFAKVKAVLEL
ncbi:Shedu anti-phage system protein SduA domain-containing protein [Agrobacterium cavarae]